MFNTVKEFFGDHLQRMAARAAAREREVDSYAAGIGALVRANWEWQQDTANRLNDARRALKAANTRAAKNAAWALLAFGLIAVEILAVALYFLPK
jgi:signal transduction histidine kinase